MQIDIFKKIQNYFYQEHDQYALWLCVGFGIGCILFFGVAPASPILIGMGILAVVLILTYAMFFRHFYLLKWGLLFTLMISAGYLYSHFYLKTTAHPILHESIGPTRIFGTVDNFTKVAPNQYRFILKNVSIPDRDNETLPYKVRLNYRTKANAEFKTHDRILAFTSLNPIAPPSYPHGFDFQKFLYFKNIGATGYILGNARVVKSKYPPPDRFFAAEKIREYIKSILKPHLSSDSFEIATALFTGDRNQIDPQILEDIRHSGLAHLLAISGLHVGLVTGLILLVMRFSLAAIPNFGLFFPIKKIAAPIAILGAGLYVYVVDAPISAQRALIMISLFLFSMIINRNTVTLRFIAIAAFVVLLLSPYAVLDAGFQMSFSAVTALVAFYENYRTKIMMREALPAKLMLYFWGIVITSMIATFATLPFTIYHFHQFIPFGILSNVIAIPITAFIIMPFGMLALILSPLHLEAFPLKILDFGIEAILWTATKTANMSFSVIHIPQMPVLGFILCAFSLIWLFLWKTNIRFVMVPIFIIALLSPFFTPKPDLILAPKGNLFTLFDDQTMRISSKQKSHFTRKVWQEAYGFNKDSEEKIIFEDNRTSFKNHEIYFIPNQQLIVDGVRIYDQAHSPNDAIAIYFHENSTRIIDNAMLRGNRPWIPKE